MRKFRILGFAIGLAVSFGSVAVAEEGCKNILYDGHCFEKLPPGDPVCLELVDEVDDSVCIMPVSGGSDPIVVPISDIQDLSAQSPRKSKSPRKVPQAKDKN